MRPRLTLDLGWSDLAAGLAACLRPLLDSGNRRSAGRAAAAARSEVLWSHDGDALACLSVRSGFDLLLTALALPSGSEVAYTAATIGDMVRIIESHDLKAVPIDLDMATLGPRPEQLERALAPRTRLLLFVHLFGDRFDLDRVAELAERRGILLVEDCAHAFVGRPWRGHPGAVASLFSFGPIKTATALGGALLTVREADLLARMRSLQESWPAQRASAFARRCAKYAALKAACWPPLYGLLFRAAALGGDPDRRIQGSVRGFGGSDLLTAIRHRPSAPLLTLLARRLRRYTPRQIEARRRVAESAVALLGDTGARPGRAAQQPTHWVFAVYAEDPPRLLAKLRAAGFDATRGTAAFGVVDPGGDLSGQRSPEARAAFERMVYLPLARGLPESELTRLCRMVRSEAGGGGTPFSSSPPSSPPPSPPPPTPPAETPDRSGQPTFGAAREGPPARSHSELRDKI